MVNEWESCRPSAALTVVGVTVNGVPLYLKIMVGVPESPPSSYIHVCQKAFIWDTDSFAGAVSAVLTSEFSKNYCIWWKAVGAASVERGAA